MAIYGINAMDLVVLSMTDFSVAPLQHLDSTLKFSKSFIESRNAFLNVP